MNSYDVKLQESSKWTPIHQAAYSNRLDILRFLLEQKNIINVNARASDGRTALHLACASARCSYNDDVVEIVRLLIEAGCDTRIRDDVYQDTALHVASRFDGVDIVRLLIKAGSDVNAFNVKNRTPLLYACKNGRLANVDVLTAAGADVNAIDSKGCTSLIVAVSRQNNDACDNTDDPKRNRHRIIGTLLRYGADANIVTKNNQFALSLSIAGCGDYETFKLLLENTDEALIQSKCILFFENVNEELWNISRYYDLFLIIEHLIQLNYIPEILQEVCHVLIHFHKVCLQHESDLWGRYETLFTSIFNKNHELNKDVNLQLIFGIHTIFEKNQRAGLKILNLLVKYGLNVDIEYCSRIMPILRQENRLVMAPEFFPAILPYCISFEPWDIIAVLKSYSLEQELPFVKDYEIYTDKTKCIDLKSLCRIAIRKTIRNKRNTTKQFLNIIESLPIPEMLKNYLRYK